MDRTRRGFVMKSLKGGIIGLVVNDEARGRLLLLPIGEHARQAPTWVRNDPKQREVVRRTRKWLEAIIDLPADVVGASMSTALQKTAEATADEKTCWERMGYLFFGPDWYRQISSVPIEPWLEGADWLRPSTTDDHVGATSDGRSRQSDSSATDDREAATATSVPETCIYSAASLLVAEALSEKEKDETSRRKKIAAEAKKRDALRQAFPGQATGLTLQGDAWQILRRRRWDRENGLRLLIDLSFTNPYAPYELKYDEEALGRALERVAVHVGLKKADVDSIRKTKKDAMSAHKHVAWGKVCLFGVGGLIVAAFGGWIAAPVLGSLLGGGAGLAGAAATAHGLALLGGGSLAMGGMGMAGGMWLVTGVASSLGLLAGGGGVLLLQLGASAARVELLKLQVSYKEILLASQVDRAIARQTLRKLEEERQVIKANLELERALNDKNSARLKDIEATLKAVEDSLSWMQKQAA